MVWTANLSNHLVSSDFTLLFTIDKGLILRSSQGELANIAVNPSEAPSFASMLDSGNFVLYNSKGEEVWQSFHNPTHTILPGQSLLPGEELVSRASETDNSDGIFRLKMQTDGNLVQYPLNVPDTAEYAYYASDTNGDNRYVTLKLDNDGRLYLVNGSINESVNLKNLSNGESTMEKKIYRMKLDVDGIFRVYSHVLDDPKGNWSILWESSGDKCVAKGICGLNAYCVNLDVNIDCRCLPGFDFVQPANWTSGCGRNSTVEGPKKVKYTMTPLEKTKWENITYSVIQPSTEEHCQQACLLDCNCEAAIFQNSQCNKQRLPLRYGKRELDDSTLVTFIKVEEVASFTQGVPGVPSKKAEKGVRIVILMIGVSLIGLALIVLVASGILVYRNYVWAYKRLNENANVELGMDVALRAFSYAELDQVTNGFKEELGKGAFGTVYKGFIPYNQKVVAVKRLDKVLIEGEREFQTEIRVTGRTHHTNLVQLIGYCLDGSNRLLVFEYMGKGSLAHLLSRPENQPNWEERIRIACDIARGILYLHEECERQIIHCDIKLGNILMDDHGRVKITDFGLAKLLKQDQTKTSTGIRGTRGHVAPEWHRKLPITVKADVYSFGIVLMEIICCRKCLEWSLSEEEAALEEWVYDCFQAHEQSKLVGDEKVEKRQLERLVKVALWCIQYEPSLRPSMRKVLLMMEGTIDIPVPPSPASFLSSIKYQGFCFVFPSGKRISLFLIHQVEYNFINVCWIYFSMCYFH
ncbi:Non-specific serine/threonine protein kinase [Bertholletia excelsa]